MTEDLSVLIFCSVCGDGKLDLALWKMFEVFQ